MLSNRGRTWTLVVGAACSLSLCDLAECQQDAPLPAPGASVKADVPSAEKGKTTGSVGPSVAGQSPQSVPTQVAQQPVRGKEDERPLWMELLKDAVAQIVGVCVGGFITYFVSRKLAYRQEDEARRDREAQRSEALTNRAHQKEEATEERLQKRLESVVAAYQELLYARQIVVHKLRDTPMGQMPPGELFAAVNRGIWLVSVRDPKSARMNVAMTLRDTLCEMIEDKTQFNTTAYEAHSAQEDILTSHLATAVQELVERLHPIPKSQFLETNWEVLKKQVEECVKKIT